MSELHPLVIVLLAIIGSVGAVAVGCALHRVLRPEEFTKPRFEAIGPEQTNFMHEVCARNRAEAFADSARPNAGGHNGGYDTRYSGMYSGNDGYYGADNSSFSRV